MKNCTFCRIIEGELQSSKVYEDGHVVAFMDTMPVNPGHVLVVPKRHFKELNEMDETTGMHLFRAAMRIERAIREADIRCEGTHLLQNNGRAALQEVLHVHLHIIPRYKGDNMKMIFERRPRSRLELDELADKIIEKLALR
jgi:histidine triad (HIT) family protein